MYSRALTNKWFVPVSVICPKREALVVEAVKSFPGRDVVIIICLIFVQCWQITQPAAAALAPANLASKVVVVLAGVTLCGAS